MNRIHDLKIAPLHFEAVKSGDKKAEIRDNTDRDFQKGDIAILKNTSTGEKIRVVITYVSTYNQPAGQVVFSFLQTEEESNNERPE